MYACNYPLPLTIALLSHHCAPEHQANTDTWASRGSLGPAAEVSFVARSELPTI